MKRRFMDKVAGSTTFIGEGTVFAGDLSGPGHFVVCGEIRGDCDLEGPLSIARNARWTGRVKAHDIVIAGEVEGDVVATGKLEIAGSAKVKGSLSGQSIAIAEGAIIDGGITVTTQVMHFLEKRDDNADDMD